MQDPRHLVWLIGFNTHSCADHGGVLLSADYHRRFSRNDSVGPSARFENRVSYFSCWLPLNQNRNASIARSQHPADMWDIPVEERTCVKIAYSPSRFPSDQDCGSPGTRN